MPIGLLKNVGSVDTKETNFVRKIFGFGQTQLEMSPSLFRNSGVMLSLWSSVWQPGRL